MNERQNFSNSIFHYLHRTYPRIGFSLCTERFSRRFSTPVGNLLLLLLSYTVCAAVAVYILLSLASILAVENIYRRDIFIYYIPRESYVLGNTFGSARALVRFLSSVHFKHRTRQSWGYIVRRPVWVSACYVYIGCSMLL